MRIGVTASKMERIEILYLELTKCSETTQKPREVFKDNIMIS